MKSICVYCGSAIGSDSAFATAARELGSQLANSGIELIYGGGRVGLMGVVADAVLAAGGRVQGVIPQALATREVAHSGLTQLHVVETMHQRKALMADLSDGFIALPGGLGTFEELFEIWTWAQLGIHSKPIGLLNVVSYFDHLLAFLDHATASRLLKPVHRETLIVSNESQDLLYRMAAFVPEAGRKWFDELPPTA